MKGKLLVSWPQHLLTPRRFFFQLILYYIAIYTLLTTSFKIFPLGDAAASIELGNRISEEANQKVLAIRDWLTANALEGILDVIIGYSSLTLYYDPIGLHKRYPMEGSVFDFIKEWLTNAYYQSVVKDHGSKKIVRIPVCYSSEFAIDIQYVSGEKKISTEEIIHLHTSSTYRVFMIGFLPGFSYLGKIDERLQMPRKPKPVPVTAGSVGLAASQTGIYPLNCPGGWQIIGKTPWRMFNPSLAEPVLLNVGDPVQFYEIGRSEYDQLMEAPEEE